MLTQIPTQRAPGFVRRANLLVQHDAFLDCGQEIVFPAGNLLARRVVTDHETVRLRPVQQPEADTRIGRMKQRTLTFNDVPMIGVVVG